MSFYLLLLCFGIFTFIYALRLSSHNKKVLAFMELVDAHIPDSKPKQIGATLKLKLALARYFTPIYSDAKLRIRPFLFLIFTIIALSVLNDMFLRLPSAVVLVVGVLLGMSMINKFNQVRIKNDFEKNFPEAIVVLNGAISSGSNITQALEYYSQHASGAIADEFKLIVRSLNIGEDPAKVFASSYKRLPFRNYYFFLITILVSLKSGAKLKEILARLGESTSRAKAMERKKLAMTSEARMSAKITAAIPFVFLFLMKFISPENFDYILNDPSGRYILYYFLGSEFVGMAMIMFFMRKL
ncbi:type II secretion system F family protein [Campylobacter sp. 19-13652]|uniref:type II secretion system F family protein n=1 Tax=Campylobacter sp. 19-13652 TaxID=2840180 RepID=UPI001C75F1A9|nr:type II secretion system F family protein [Campylobacter sp. 19-13652]BCX78551.1 TadB involved in pilus formation and/or protein secretion [Campylobacter sp. 19-13652]